MKEKFHHGCKYEMLNAYSICSLQKHLKDIVKESLILSLLFVVLFYPSPVLSEVREKDSVELSRATQFILNDFRPVMARVVGSGKVIELDAGSALGVRVNDLFSIYSSSGQGASSMRARLVGVVQVVAIQSRRSVCRVIKAFGPISVGQDALRYSGLRATIVAKNVPQSVTYHMYERLSKGLWSLKWTPPTLVKGAVEKEWGHLSKGVDLIFYVAPHVIKVYGIGGVAFRSYTIEGLPEGENLHRTERALSSTSSLSSFNKLGFLDWSPRQVAMGDLDKDGLIEVYTLVGKDLYVDEYKGGGSVVFLEVAGPGEEALGVSVSDDLGLVVVNVLEEGIGLHSRIYKLEKGRLLEAVTDLNLWLSIGRFLTQGEVLLGQEYIGNGVFPREPRVFHMAVKGRRLLYLNSFSAPEGFRLDQGQVLSRDSFLYKGPQGEVLWATRDGNGFSVHPLDLPKRVIEYIPLIKFAFVYGDKDQGAAIILPFLSKDYEESILYDFTMVVNQMGCKMLFDPLDGEIVGIKYGLGRLYLAISRKGSGTDLYEVSGTW